jgi:hypothetical protein
MPRRFFWLVFGSIALAVVAMTGGILISVAPHLGWFGEEGRGCADVRDGTHRGRFATGASVCRQSGIDAMLSVCGADGRWTHRKVERC